MAVKNISHQIEYRNVYSLNFINWRPAKLHF